MIAPLDGMAEEAAARGGGGAVVVWLRDDGGATGESATALDADTIFEVEDPLRGRRYLLNVASTVRVARSSADIDGGGGGGAFAFRNPPHFNSLVDSEQNLRDPAYETEAVLDSYLYHPNVAPFVATRLIQRFVTSNPSPRYVEAVARAFTNGTHAGLGTGAYGDLLATTAAILLDREV